MPVKEKRAVAFYLVAAFLLGAALWLTLNESGLDSHRPVAYVVCGDEDFRSQRVYQVDLWGGGRLGVSDPIEWMGHPTQLAIDRQRRRLYIGSFRGKARDYYPMTVVNIQNGGFKVADQFTTNPEDVLPRDSRRLNTKPHEVYQVAVSPDGNELYLMHGGMSEGMLGAVWDASTGAVLRELEFPVQKIHVLTPDGRYFARIWPDRQRTQDENGEMTTEKIPARIEVRDVQTGRRVSLTYPENGKGLHPPWGHAEGPLVRVHGSGRTLAYDRDTGETVSDFNIDQLTGLSTFAGSKWDEPPVLDDHRTIVLNMFNANAGRMFVVAIDVLGQLEMTRTEVSSNCTNPVVGYK